MSDNLSIIKGDDLDADVIVDTKGIAGIVEDVYFTCSELGLQQQLSYDVLRDVYRLHIPHGQTADLPAINTTYDITVRLRGNTVATAIFNSRLTVREKQNGVVI